MNKFVLNSITFTVSIEENECAFRIGAQLGDTINYYSIHREAYDFDHLHEYELFKSNLQNDIDNGRFSLSTPVRDSVEITFTTGPDAQIPNYKTSLYVNEDEEWIGDIMYERRQFEKLLAEISAVRSENLMLRETIDAVKKIMSSNGPLDPNDALKAITMLDAIDTSVAAVETVEADPTIKFNANNVEYPQNDDVDMTE